MLNWTNDEINVLGIKVANDNDKVVSDNYEPLLAKVKSVLLQWQNRGLSLLGKVNVVNTLVGSLFVYKMQVLLSPSTSFIRQVEEVVVKFLWNGAWPKIPLKQLQLAKTQGGLNLVNLEWKDISLKSCWPAMLAADSTLSSLSYELLVPELKERIWDCNLNETDVDFWIANPFWNNVLKAWSKINYQPVVKGDIGKQCLWLNSLIRSNNKPLWWKEGFKLGLITISDLYSEGML